MRLELQFKADSRYRFNRKKVRAAVTQLLVEQGISEVVSLSISIVGERKIRELEKLYFGEDRVTDVLSFPQNEGQQLETSEKKWSLGDVVVCYPQAKRQAIKLNRLLDDEIEFLVCHGVLHLLGIHHD